MTRIGAAQGTLAHMQVRTTITLEDGRAYEIPLGPDPAREGLWFVDVEAIAGADDHPKVGPFGSEADARAWLLGRIEREVGRIREIRRHEESSG